MPSRTCPRCHTDLPAEDGGSLTFCSNCGMPQVVLSEELRERFAEQQQAGKQGTAQSAEEGIEQTDGDLLPIDAHTDPTDVDWRFALQLAAFAGVFVLPLLFLSYAVPAIGLLLSLWVLGTPIVLLGLYAARKPSTRITTGFGARLGLLSGISIGLTLLLAMTLNLFLQRFVAHQDKSFDQQIQQQMSEAMKKASLTNDGGAADKEAAADMAQLQRELAIPEFRTGFVLTGLLAAIGFYAIYSSATGAFSGYLRSRVPRQRMS